MKSTFLIACSREKRAERAPAKDLYLSERFRLCRTAAEVYADKWFIVSAKHGLVHPERILSPYDTTIANMTPREFEMWNKKVTNQLARWVPKQSNIVCLGDSQYFSPLAKLDLKAGAGVHIPFRWIDPSNHLTWLRKIQPMNSTVRDLDRLYDMLSIAELREQHMRVFGSCSGSAKWPRRGLYIFYDPRHRRMFKPNAVKIIRIGTHAVSQGSASSLWQRLKNHKGQQDGSGNHRGSIFRLHVGGALMTTRSIICPSWGVGMSAIEDIRTKENDLEITVSKYLASLQVVALDINDEPSKISDRAYLEQNMIALLSGRAGPVEIADESWLGYHCRNKAVCKASLWNVDYTELDYDPIFLDVVEKYIAVTIGKTKPPDVPLAPKSWYEKAKSGYRQATLDFS
jgi:hypothetical protein